MWALCINEMKRPKIKDWDCACHDPIEDWIPSDPFDVEFWCNLSIGIEGEEGADNFSVHIATNKALSRIKDKENLFVISHYENWTKVLAALDSAIEDCSDINWAGISARLAKRFYWEYQGV